MKRIALLLGVLALIPLAMAFSPLRSLFQPTEERVRSIVEQDIQNLMGSGQVGDFWSSIKDIEIKYSDGSLFHYLTREDIPVTLQEGGKYELHIQVLRWIEGHKHGLNMDFEVFDTATSNKVAEFGRTYHIGYIW